MKKHLQPLTPAALYARVSSDRQDVDLSVSAQLRALKDYARANGYSVAREYVDEAESGRVADRPQFREMIEEGSKPNAPFEVILVWKFSRFTRKREHAVAFKSMLVNWKCLPPSLGQVPATGSEVGCLRLWSRSRPRRERPAGAPPRPAVPRPG